MAQQWPPALATVGLHCAETTEQVGNGLGNNGKAEDLLVSVMTVFCVLYLHICQSHDSEKYRYLATLKFIYMQHRRSCEHINVKT